MSRHTGGCLYGRMRSSWPFVTLTIAADGISMTSILQDIRLRRETIRAITLRKTFINNRFVFEHDDPALKSAIEFWSFSPEPVLTAFRSYGYDVVDSR